MTDDRMALFELIEKRADTDLVREMLAFVAERLNGTVEIPGSPKGSSCYARDPWTPTPDPRKKVLCSSSLCQKLACIVGGVLM